MSRVELPAYRHGVFAVHEAATFGWTYSAIRRATQTKRLVRVRPGAYWIVSPRKADSHARRRERHLIHAIALAVTTRNAVLSHHSSALLYGLPTLQLPSQPCITVADRSLSTVTGGHLHHAPVQLYRIGDLRLTSAARTVVDISREFGIRAGLVAADAAVKSTLCDIAALQTTLESCVRWPGVNAARTVVELTDGRSESPLETLSRLALRGLVPAPDLQTCIEDLDGNFLARVDFFWAEYAVVGEVDGMSKYADASVLRNEKRRQERLEQAGLIVVRWTADELLEVPRLVARLLAAFAQSAAHTNRPGWIAHPVPRP